jgi:hypothetical protein
MNEKQIAERRDETIKRMLSTPPAPHKPVTSKKKKAAKKKR